MNTTLQQLGFDAQDRVLIVHADDIGMCQATIAGITDMLDFGVLSSASVMVPCPWILEAAAFCRDHPTVDMGVHLTLNCEWSRYRWGPITTRDPATGLLDAQGYFHQWPPATTEQADPAAVATEVEAQIREALAAGIDPTHVDVHMGTAAHPRFVRSYIDAALAQHLPPFMSKQNLAFIERSGLDQDAIADYASLIDELPTKGVALVDNIAFLPLDNPNDQPALMKKIIDDLQPGLTVMIFHPAKDTPELRAIAPDWPSRVANYEVAINPEVRDHLRNSGVQLIGYRHLRDTLRAAK